MLSMDSKGARDLQGSQQSAKENNRKTMRTVAELEWRLKSIRDITATKVSPEAAILRPLIDTGLWTPRK